MYAGKLPNSELQKIVLGKIKNFKKEVLVGAGIGEDCSVIDFGGNLCVITSDPITAASENSGELAVNVCCNDLAAKGAEPLGLMVTLLFPPGIEKAQIEKIVDEICYASFSKDMQIIGGHTEITPSVNSVVISCTALGTLDKNLFNNIPKPEPGDDIVMTKHAGLEGTAIIASEYEKELTQFFGKDFVSECKSYYTLTSVLEDSREARKHGFKSMHDATEGGILGALWELIYSTGYGADIYKNEISVTKTTHTLCEYFDIDPLRLISSGCLLIICPDGKELCRKLKDKGINANVIGKLKTEKGMFLIDGIDGKNRIDIDEPQSDELYKVIKKVFK